jgi:hypothetical protein
VNSKRTKRTIARFDKDGKFETHNPVIIAEEKGIETHKIKQADLIKALEECER